MPKIRAAGTSFDLAAYEQDPGAFAELLARAKQAFGHVLCECTAPPQELVVRCVAGTGERPARYFLAGWPNRGTGHRRDCPFYRSDETYAEARARMAAAVVESRDGFGIKPQFALRRVLAPGAQAPSPAVRREAGTPAVKAPARSSVAPARDALSLSETLDYLWRAAGLTAALPQQQRDWQQVAEALRGVIARGRLGNQPMDRLVYVVPRYLRSRHEEIAAGWRAFAARFGRASDAVPLFFVLGVIKYNERVGRSVATHLRHHAQALYMPFRLATALASRYPDAEACLVSGDPARRVIGLYQVELSERGQLWVNDAALLPLYRDFLPLPAGVPDPI